MAYTESHLEDDLKRLKKLKQWAKDQGDIFPIPPGDDTDDIHWVNFLFMFVTRMHKRNQKSECGWCGWTVHRDPDIDWKMMMSKHLLSCKKHPISSISEANIVYRDVIREAMTAIGDIVCASSLGDIKAASRVAAETLTSIAKKLEELPTQKEEEE